VATEIIQDHRLQAVGEAMSLLTVKASLATEQGLLEMVCSLRMIAIQITKFMLRAIDRTPRMRLVKLTEPNNYIKVPIQLDHPM
jgi:hypothetical protein